MLVFLGTEAMFFAGLVSAFIVLRASVSPWPPVDQPRFPIPLTAANTMILLGSGVTMARALTARRAARRRDVVRWLLVTVALGLTFLAVQGIEWWGLVQDGLRVRRGTYGSLFTTLIGTHALHALGGIVAVVGTWLAARRTRLVLREEILLPVALYWWFVVLVWPILFVLVYLT
jgi:heme/copper-type cytochrome/quinol oxidase subunit 3